MKLFINLTANIKKSLKEFWAYINKHQVLSGIVAGTVVLVIVFLITPYFSASDKGNNVDNTIYYDAGEAPKDRALNTTEEYSKLRKLAVGVKITHSKDLLGKESFVNQLSGEVTEYVFVNPLYYVEVATDIENTVLFYSVTTRKENFNPKFEFFSKEIDSNGKWGQKMGSATIYARI